MNGDPRRRFPPTTESFIVHDANGQALLAYVYYEEEPGPQIGSEPAHPRRGQTHREHRQAAGVAAGSHATVKNNGSLSPNSGRIRCVALTDVMGKEETFHLFIQSGDFDYVWYGTSSSMDSNPDEV
jgi:hypothetical protein